MAAAESLPSAFTFADDRVPMNAANLCPMPAAIGDAVARYSGELATDMSGPNRRRIEAHKETARKGIATALNVAADEIAIVRNTSEANNVVVQGIALSATDEVLLWDQNHPSNGVAWAVRARRTGCEVRQFSIPAEPGSVDEVVDSIVDALGARTRVVSFTHVSNVTGFRLPVREVCAALRRKSENLHIHVDGAQTWGAIDIDLRATDCDSFSGSAHKWYMGPREVGMLYVRSERLDDIWPQVVSIPWGSEAEPSVIGARRYEALGQRDDAAIAGLAETVAFHASITPAAVAQQAVDIADQLRSALREIDAPLLSTVNPLFTSNVIILKAPADNRPQLLENVLRDGGVILAGVNGLRLSPHIYNSADHVERVTAAIAKSRELLG